MKKILKEGWAQNVVAFVASLYVRFVYHTCCWKKEGFHIPKTYLEQKKPFITCFWHSRLLLLPYAWDEGEESFYMLISAHKDGRIISKTVEYFGIETVPGSTKKGGAEALVKMVRLSRSGKTIGITPDGPKGPAEEVSDGTVMAAYLAKADLIPVTYSVKRHKRWRSWDRFFLPFPFSKGVLIWGDPVPFPQNKDQFAEAKKKLKKQMVQLSKSADKRVGG